MDGAASTDIEWVTVKTTIPALPYPPLEDRRHVRTGRLVLRPLRESDLDELHVLRTQPEVMAFTVQGRPDADLEATRKHLDMQLHTEGLYNFAICLAATGEMIGLGGGHKLKGELGWPVVGYIFRREYWGKGYATEFLQAFLKEWWTLPRREVEVQVAKETVECSDGEVAPECMVGVTVEGNKGSMGVMTKSGMRLVKIFEDEDLHHPGSGLTVTVYGFATTKPSTD